MTTVEEALADVKPEGDTDPFKDLDTKEADKEKETTTESLTEKKPEVEEPNQGKNTDDKQVPFHEHPRWKEREEELKRLRAFEQTASEKLAEFDKIKSAFDSKSGEKSSIPDWFKHLYGENEVAWQAYSEHSKLEREEMKKELIAEQEARREESQKEEQRWNKWVEDGLEGLKTLGLEFDRNALLKTMLDNPEKVTREGNFDFNLGYKLYRELNPDTTQANSQARKKIADTATKSSPAEKGSKDFMTSNELRNKSWNQL